MPEQGASEILPFTPLHRAVGVAFGVAGAGLELDCGTHQPVGHGLATQSCHRLVDGFGIHTVARGEFRLGRTGQSGLWQAELPSECRRRCGSRTGCCESELNHGFNEVKLNTQNVYD
jgi:hypothetical protein